MFASPDQVRGRLRAIAGTLSERALGRKAHSFSRPQISKLSRLNPFRAEFIRPMKNCRYEAGTGDKRLELGGLTPYCVRTRGSSGPGLSDRVRSSRPHTPGRLRPRAQFAQDLYDP